MPIDEISSVASISPPAAGQPNRIRTSTSSQPVMAAAASQEVPPSQQIASLINQTLQDLNFVSPSPTNDLLLNELAPNLATLIDTQNLTPAQLAALAINDTLLNLNVVSPSPTETLLINELNPATTTFLESQNLTPVQQAALAVNETLQTLITTPQAANAISGQETGAIAQAAPSTPLAAPPLAPATTTGPEPIVVAETPATVAATTVAVPPGAATAVVSAEAIPTPPELPPLILDRNPIAVPVYEVRDPKVAPAEPRPRRREVVPLPPIGRVRPVDRLVLRREWERRKGGGRGAEVLPQPPAPEKAIQQMVGQVNDDLADSGLPLRLVLAKTGEGYSIDVFDCSDDTACRLAQEVHVDLSKLLTTLDNLQHETGIMVNIKA